MQGGFAITTLTLSLSCTMDVYDGVTAILEYHLCKIIKVTYVDIDNGPVCKGEFTIGDLDAVLIVYDGGRK